MTRIRDVTKITKSSDHQITKAQMIEWRGASKAELEAVDPHKPLRETLAEMTANVEALIGAEKLAAPLRAIEELRTGGAEQRILPVGARAPEFELTDQHKKPVLSRELLAHGRLILVFFRGRWDPYCMATLEAWQARRQQ